MAEKRQYRYIGLKAGQTIVFTVDGVPIVMGEVVAEEWGSSTRPRVTLTTRLYKIFAKKFPPTASISFLEERSWTIEPTDLSERAVELEYEAELERRSMHRGNKVD